MRVEAAGTPAEAADAAGRLNPAYSRRLQPAGMKSRFMCASLGLTASHSPMLAQLPNNSRLAAATIPPGIPTLRRS